MNRLAGLLADLLTSRRGQRVTISAQALAEHYATDGEKVRLADFSEPFKQATGFKVPIVRGRWPLLDSVHAHHGAVRLVIDSPRAAEQQYYLDPRDEVVVVA